MADEKPIAGSETPPATTPVTGDASKGEMPKEPKTTAATSRDDFQKLQDENARRRKENQELSARLKQFEDAQLSETERVAKAAQEAQARAEKAEQAYRREVALNAVRDVATELGFNARLAARLLVEHDWDYDDSGRPRSVRETLRRLAEEFPELTASTTTADLTNHQRGGAATVTSTRRPRLTDPDLWEPH